MNTGEKIKLFRRIKGYSQEEMAERLEISVNAYGRIERNETNLNMSRLEQIAKSFDVSIEEMLSISDRTLNYAKHNNGVVGNPVHAHINTENELAHQLEMAELKIKGLERELKLKDEIIEALRK